MFDISKITGLEEAKGINLSFSAYPVPTTDFLTLEVDASATHNKQCMICKENFYKAKKTPIAIQELL
jgi:hypothetical protein